MTRRKLTNDERKLLTAVNAARNFPINTCPASRHVQMAAELLMKHGRHVMIEEEPEHIAGSMLSVVASLFEARTMFADAGIDWFPAEKRRAIETYRERRAREKDEIFA